MKAALLTLVISLSALAAATQSSDEIPNFTVREIREASPEVRDAVRSLGAFSLSGLPDAAVYRGALDKLKTEAVGCLRNGGDAQVRSSLLEGSAVRFTSGRASSEEGDSPIRGHPDCVELDEIERAFDWTTVLVHGLVEDILGDVPTFYAEDATGARARVPLRSSPHLDHLHAYVWPDNVDASARHLIPPHADNGLFLVVTPTPEHPLLVESAKGEYLAASRGDVVVLFGRAMEDWLRQGKEGGRLFRAAPHAVRNTNTEDRVVFARMVVAADGAVPEKGKGHKTFGEVFHGKGSSEHVLCASDLFDRANRAECEEGYDWCWMSCVVYNDECDAGDQVCETPSGDPCCLETSDGGCLMDGQCDWQCP